MTLSLLYALLCSIPLGIVAISMLIGWILYSTAPDGYEDETGFHRITHDH